MGLSETQYEALRELNEADVKLSVSQGFEPSAWIFRTKPHKYISVRMATLGVLQEKKLIEKVGERSGMIDYYIISDKGSQALKEQT